MAIVLLLLSIFNGVPEELGVNRYSENLPPWLRTPGFHTCDELFSFPHPFVRLGQRSR